MTVCSNLRKGPGCSRHHEGAVLRIGGRGVGPGSCRRLDGVGWLGFCNFVPLVSLTHDPRAHAQMEEMQLAAARLEADRAASAAAADRARADREVITHTCLSSIFALSRLQREPLPSPHLPPKQTAWATQPRTPRTHLAPRLVRSANHRPKYNGSELHAHVTARRGCVP